ncbi:MAG: hypothetical protein OFPI_28450 [Osedax symbiont Rs2]|nr:MAG: hypothetical protein OFPI_28450 [Osedax symbiont Rs2]
MIRKYADSMLQFCQLTTTPFFSTNGSTNKRHKLLVID